MKLNIKISVTYMVESKLFEASIQILLLLLLAGSHSMISQVDITCEDHVLEAGLGFAVKTSKPAFVGRDAVLGGGSN